MKTGLSVILMGVVLLGASVEASPHVDRSYVGLYQNPRPMNHYRHVYAGHYVRKQRPHKMIQVYERTTYPRDYGTWRYRGAEPPRVQVDRKPIPQPGFNLNRPAPWEAR